MSYIVSAARRRRERFIRPRAAPVAPASSMRSTLSRVMSIDVRQRQLKAERNQSTSASRRRSPSPRCLESGARLPFPRVIARSAEGRT